MKARLTLYWSAHAHQRSRERRISAVIAELVFHEGRQLERNRDRFLLTADQVKALQNLYPTDLLERAARAAPLLVVAVGTKVITLFRVRGRIGREKNHKKGWLHQ